MTTDEGPRCNQSVTAEGYGDDCCGPQAACGVPATWLHEESGLGLCDEHEANAQRYSFNSGSWRVGDLSVSYPDGWRHLEVAPPAESSVLEVVRFAGSALLDPR